jgi:hypothetical protein
VAPTAPENLPASQMSQTVEAVAAEYVLAAQLVQTVAASAAEYLPAAQSRQTVAPTPEDLPATQYVHASCAASRYFPAAQGAHESHVPLDSDISAISVG